MKKLFLLLMLVLGHTFGNGQSTDWKEIKPIRILGVNLLYQSSNGLLIGYMVAHKKIAFSFDNGKNWNISPSIPSNAINNNSRNYFKESNLGKIYYFYRNIVYVFDTGSSDFVKLINFPSYTEIDDIGIIYNEDIIIAADDELFLYSDIGELKNDYKIYTGSAKILTARDSIGKNFLINKFSTLNNIYEFSIDLNFVGNNYSIVSNTFKLVRHKDRLISYESYSNDNGATWKNILEFWGKTVKYMNVSHDNNIYALTDNEVFISKDGGLTFKIIDYGFKDIDYISSSINNIMVLTNIENCNSKTYTSSDLGQNWIPFENNIEIPYANRSFPGINENLFTKDCNTLRKKGSSLNWELLNLTEGQGTNLDPNLYNLSNNDIIAQTSSTLKKSKDQGDTWFDLENRYNYSITKNRLIEKQGVIYHFDKDSLHYSNDYGDSWNVLPVSNELNVTFTGSMEFTNNYELFHYNFIDRKIVKYNFLNQQITNLNLAQEYSPFTDFTTSFDGSQLFIISEKQNNNLEFYTTTDDGITLTRNIIEFDKSNGNYELKTDHLGNIYIRTESIVLLSSDQGASWQNITPDFPELISINDIQISFDNYIYLSTTGKGILKYNFQLSEPKQLKISLYDDENKNCQQDTNEVAIHRGKIVVNNNYVKAVNGNGEATFNVNRIQNTVSVQFNDKIYDYCEASYDVDMSTGTNSISIPLKSKKYCADLVTSISTPFLRRCFDNTYYGQVCNEGNIDAEKTEVKIILDDYFDLIQANLPQLSHVGNELTLDAGTIKPGECKNINFTINLSCDATLGQEHCVIIDSESPSQSCNSIETRTEYTECQDNIGSFDPNDKAIFVNGVRNQTYLEPGDKLEYMIRFQNTGTDTAFTVKIQDPISTKFDVASMRPVAASHDYVWSIDNGTLNVVFNQIMLVDSFKNEPASHGFIKFEITLDEKTMLNEEVSNIAGIYFDFNEPIITNEVVTPVGKPVFTNDWSVSPFFIYPNPTTDFLSLGINDAKFKTGKVNIFDQKGGKLMTSDFNVGLSNRINVSQLPSGFYILQVINNNSEFKTKFVKL